VNPSRAGCSLVTEKLPVIAGKSGHIEDLKGVKKKKGHERKSGLEGAVANIPQGGGS